MESVVSNENKPEDVTEDGNKVPETNDDNDEFLELMNLFSHDDDNNDDDDDDLYALKMLQAISEQDDDSEDNDNTNSVTANDLDKKKVGNNKVKAQYRWRFWFWSRKARRMAKKFRKFARRIKYRLRGRGGKGGLPDYPDYGQQING